MRPSVLDRGHRLRARLFFRITSAGDAPDVVRMLLYRPGFFARPLLAITVPAMRGESAWSAAEREYLAMTIARRYASEFCAVTHAEMVRIAGQGAIDPADPASVRPEVRAAGDFLDALHRAPDTAVPPPGVSAAALRDALDVGLVWDVINRLANAFGFALRGDQLHTGTRALHRFGYRFPGFLLAGGPRTDRDDPVAALRHAVLAAPAATPPELRAAAAAGDGLDEPWRSYAARVRDASDTIGDDDVARLAAAYGEDAVFEVTVAAAVGAALATYDAGQKIVTAG